MKTLKNYYESKGFEVMPVNFKRAASGQRTKRKGFDIVRADGRIMATFEPTSYSHGSFYARDKWFVTAERMYYIPRITAKRLDEIELRQDPYRVRADMMP